MREGDSERGARGRLSVGFAAARGERGYKGMPGQTGPNGHMGFQGQVCEAQVVLESIND